MSQTAGEGVFNLMTKTGQSGEVAERCKSGLLIISRGTAILLLMVYIAYLVFQLKTHAYLFTVGGDEAAEGGQDCEAGRPHHDGPCRQDSQAEVEEPQMAPLAAVIALMLVTVVTAFAADHRE